MVGLKVNEQKLEAA
jgi:UBX domain-containing protein 6